MSPVSQEQSGSFPDLRHDETAIASPGALLRDRRVALNLNEWDIAREMRLQTQYILDLEADNFDAFSSLAFVRGYLRGYAKIVGIAEVEIMQLFNQLSLQDKNTAGVPKYITHGKSHGDRYWRWMGLAVIGFVVVSLVLWWQNYNSSLKNMNTSVNSTLQKVSALQNNLNAQQAQNAEVAAGTSGTDTPTVAEVTGTLGTSTPLLGDVATTPATQNNAATATTQTVATTPAANSNTMTSTPVTTNTMTPAATTPSAPSTTPSASAPARATTANTPSTTANTAASTATTPAATTNSMTTAPTTATTAATANAATPAPASPKRKVRSNTGLNSANDPIVDGQAPRLDTSN